MSSKKKRKSPCPFARTFKAEKAANFDKDCADVLAARDRGSYFEQEKLIALDEEYERCLQYVRSANFLINTRTSPWVSFPLYTRTLFTTFLPDFGTSQPVQLDGI